MGTQNFSFVSLLGVADYSRNLSPFNSPCVDSLHYVPIYFSIALYSGTEVSHVGAEW